jgi:hypothetical protein
MPVMTADAARNMMTQMFSCTSGHRYLFRRITVSTIVKEGWGCSNLVCVDDRENLLFVDPNLPNDWSYTLSCRSKPMKSR